SLSPSTRGWPRSRLIPPPRAWWRCPGKPGKRRRPPPSKHLAGRGTAVGEAGDGMNGLDWDIAAGTFAATKRLSPDIALQPVPGEPDTWRSRAERACFVCAAETWGVLPAGWYMLEGM